MACAETSMPAASPGVVGCDAMRSAAERAPDPMHTAATDRRIDELESFVRAMAHDAGALTRGIALRAELLRERLGQVSPPETEALIAGITERANRLGRMSEALLRLARVDAIDIERTQIDLSTLADEVLAELRREHPARTAECIVRRGMIVHGDPALIRLLLENLLGNAWKYTARTPATKIEFGCRRSGGETAYYVADNGIGLPRENTAALFSPFVRLASAQTYPGTGLGLVIAKQIVERHGGWIRADAAAGNGAAFVFSLGASAQRRDTAGAA